MLMPKHESTEPLVRSLTEYPHHYRMILMLDITLSELQVPKLQYSSRQKKFCSNGIKG